MVDFDVAIDGRGVVGTAAEIGVVWQIPWQSRDCRF
jgi:hypothetical protein